MKKSLNVEIYLIRLFLLLFLLLLGFLRSGGSRGTSTTSSSGGTTGRNGSELLLTLGNDLCNTRLGTKKKF
jgi:hypothetical protein